MAKNYYDDEQFEFIVQSIRNNSQAPNWLADVLQVLGQAHANFPCEEDENRFVVEFIYPH